MDSYTCAICGGSHDGAPLAYGFVAPALVETIPPSERPRRCELSSDQCIVDDEHFFVLGNLELPIVGLEERFVWTCWVSLSRDRFVRTQELWNAEGRESEPPYFGWLSSSIPGYPETLNLKTHVHTRPVGQRPAIELEPTEHPLAMEQRTGIPRLRIAELASIMAHGGG